MLAINGNTRETSISTPAMGHDSAWRKAAMVTIIAAMLPRSSRGLDDISSTTDIVEKSILLAQNGIVTWRAQEEGYAVLLRSTTIFRRGVPYHRKRSEYPDLWLYEHLSNSNAIFLFLNILFDGAPQVLVIFPRPTLQGPSSITPEA